MSKMAVSGLSFHFARAFWVVGFLLEESMKMRHFMFCGCADSPSTRHPALSLKVLPEIGKIKDGRQKVYFSVLLLLVNIITWFWWLLLHYFVQLIQMNNFKAVWTILHLTLCKIQDGRPQKISFNVNWKFILKTK